ncbi:MAG TPA: hypothetical protein DCQ31_00225, partial [Bacteroidales bacterium]|nr:hypothetical protein [Bacteroidales bacterium]
MVMKTTTSLVHKLCFVVLLIGLPFKSFGNEKEPQNNDSIKTLITQFQKENNLIAANRLLNQNTALEVEYTFGVLNENLNLAKKTAQFEALAYTYLSIGNFWFMRGNKIKAYENYRESEMISRKHGYAKITGLALMNASNVSSNMDKRIEQLKLAVPYFNNANDLLNLSKAYLNIGSCYSSYVLGAKILSVSNPTDSILPITQTETNKIQFRDSAFRYYRLAENLNDSLQHPEVWASYNLRIAQWLKYDQNYALAEKHYRLSNQYFSRANLFKGSVYNMLELAELKMQQQNYAQALKLADSTLILAQNYGFTDYYSDACLLISEIYERLNNYGAAIEYYKLYHNNSLQSNASLKDEKI